MENYRERCLHILTAGCVLGPVQKTVERWNRLHPDSPAVVQKGGSVDLVRRVKSGETCDVLLSADDAIIESMLMPDYVDGYRVFAGNKMVIMGPSITSENWKEKLLAPDAVFGHSNPYVDPGGYRADMTLLLADNVEPGLSEKLMNHPGHRGMERDAGGPPKPGEGCYAIYYYTGALAKGEPFAELPACMDLSNEALADVYAKASFAVDAENVVHGTPIRHAIALPRASAHLEQAREFAMLFLENDFAAMHYLPREKTVGRWA